MSKHLNSSGFFAAVTGSGSSDMALWKSDGTLAGTFKLKEIEPDFSRGTVVLNNAMYFAAALTSYGERMEQVQERIRSRYSCGLSYTL
ncbi:MAG: hypothetical protein IPG01_13185 [Chitinophagaceae bacterium]|nr:hypothetical protein [Chitinophagaceae bacterium]